MRLYFKSVLSTESELSKRLLSKTKIPPQIVKVSLTPVNLHLQFLNPICGAPSFPWSIFSLPLKVKVLADQSCLTLQPHELQPTRLLCP